MTRSFHHVAGMALVLLGVGIMAASAPAGEPASAATLGPAWVGALAAPEPVAPADPAEVAFVREACARAAPSELDECLLASLERILAEEGAGQAFAMLEALAEEPRVAQLGHPLAHDLGRFAFRHHGSAEAAFLVCPPNMASGCYHGVLEAYVRGLGGALDADALGDVCGRAVLEARGPFGQFQCLHGMGHGLMMYAGYDLDRSLALCDLLRSEWERGSCHGGVFMENIASAIGVQRFRDDAHDPHAGHHGHSRGAPDPTRPLHPCDAVDARYGSACFLIQTAAILHFNGHDFAAAFAACDAAPAPFVPDCYRSMGRDISGATDRDAIRTLELCDLGAEGHRVHCVSGAAKDFMNADARPEPGIDLCRRAAAPDRPACFAAAGEMMLVLVPDAASRAEACGRLVEDAYVGLCAGSERAPA